MKITQVSGDDDLQQLVSDINSAEWDDANEMTDYQVDSLREYLQHEDTLFISCYNELDGRCRLAGIASARIQIKPYDKELWLYVDEVDVCVDQRRKGIGQAIMNEFLDIARSKGCHELWLGTEIENVAANALYKSLSPDEVQTFVGFNFELDD